MLPLHVHHQDTQTTYVLEGQATFYSPGESRVLGPGECIHQPAGVAHTERVASNGPARMLDVNSPAGFEKFVAAAAEPAGSLELPPEMNEPPDFDRLSKTAGEHGIKILGPPGTLP